MERHLKILLSFG